jgi:Phospholipase_D-nuclease N-terminal
MARVGVARGTAIDSFGTKRKEAKMMDFGYGGLVGVLILIGDVWAIINILQSSVSNEKKLIWTIAVVLLPLLGLILWFFLGPRGGKA